jgi:predicted acyltransferase (DUF342 family)
MKNLKFLILSIVIMSSHKELSAQNIPINADSTFNKKIIVEASCGQCQFKMQGKGCSLAVRINNHSYFVDNANIDQFGDAHSDEGFCNAIRKAKVTGKIVNDRFVVSTFELVDKK